MRKLLQWSQLIAVAGLAALSAAGAEIVIPPGPLDRNGVISALWRLNGPVTGEAELSLTWTDSLGRTLEERRATIRLADEAEFRFPLDLRRTVAMSHRLAGRLRVRGADRKGPVAREETAETTFIVRPGEARWRDYEIMMWQPYPAPLLPKLETLGISGGQANGRSGVAPEAMVAANQRWYAENLATDFYAEYHRFRPDRVPHWSFLEAKERWKKDPQSLEAFKRHPSLEDAGWRERVRQRVTESARKLMPYRPFFYSLADETGIADLAAFWDFDFSDYSLDGMRAWLRERYGSLPALNAEWGSDFTSWDLVRPPTTHEAMARPGENFAAWADFKEWMDISFAGALRMGRDAIEKVDPYAYVNIGGGQRPGWGGYDYARLTKALTMVEPYDIGANVEIIRSLNPEMVMVSTGFAKGPWERHRLWRELFHGHRGLIIWDERREYVGADGQPGPRGVEAAAYYKELRSGIGALIIASRPVTEPIAVHYSQASMRTEWMLARRPEGDKWVERNAKIERTDDEFLRLRESWCQLIEDQGMQYRFVSYDQLEAGELLRGGYRVLVLPRSSALSAAEVRAIREFTAQGGVVIADGEPGAFNEHSRKMPAPALADLFTGTNPAGVRVTAKTLTYHMDRLRHQEGEAHKAVGDLLRRTVQPEIAVTDAAGRPVVGVETHVFRNGGATLVTLLSNPLLRVDELGPPDFRSNERFETPIKVTVTLPEAAQVNDVRTGRALGTQKTLTVTVPAYEPVILAVTPRAWPKLALTVPATIARGETATAALDAPGTPAGSHVFHVEVWNPAGELVRPYSGNVIAEGGRGARLLPLALNDPAGEWKVRVRDLWSGQTVEKKMVVK